MSWGARNAERWPRVYFWHLPKTSGTSFGDWLRRQYPRALVLGANSRQDLIDPRLGAFDAYRCFIGHFGTAIPRLLAQPIDGVTLLRDPIERSMSHLRWVQREPPPLQQFPRRRAQYEAVRRHGDDLDACLDDPLVRDTLWNVQARLLVDPVDVAAYLGGTRERFQAYLDEVDEGPLPSEQALLAAGRAQLDAMLAVGSFERFEESAGSIARALGLPPPLRWPRENVSPELRREAGFRWRDTLSAHALAQLDALTAVDRELHSYVQARLERQLAEQARETAVLRDAQRRAIARDARWDAVPLRERLARVAAACRFGEWWEHELPPLLLLAYVCFAARAVPLTSQPWLFAGLLAALAGLGVIARVTRGWGDVETDAAVARPNRVRRLPASARLGLLGAAGLGGAAGLIAAGAGAPALATWAASAALHALLAFPPARLRARGGAGLVASVLALHALPALLVLQLAGPAAGGVRLALAATALAWVTAWGARCTLWSQFRERTGDLQVGLGTLAARVESRRLRRFGERVVLPLELACLAAFLTLSGVGATGLAVGGFALAELARLRQGGRAVAVKPRSGAGLWLGELYEAWLPYAVLAAQALRFGADAAALAAHVLLFPRRLTRLGGAARQRLRRRAG